MSAEHRCPKCGFRILPDGSHDPFELRPSKCWDGPGSLGPNPELAYTPDDGGGGEEPEP